MLLGAGERTFALIARNDIKKERGRRDGDLQGEIFHADQLSGLIGEVAAIGAKHHCVEDDLLAWLDGAGVACAEDHTVDSDGARGNLDNLITVDYAEIVNCAGFDDPQRED